MIVFPRGCTKCYPPSKANWPVPYPGIHVYTVYLTWPHLSRPHPISSSPPGPNCPGPAPTLFPEPTHHFYIYISKYGYISKMSRPGPALIQRARKEMLHLTPNIRHIYQMSWPGPAPESRKPERKCSTWPHESPVPSPTNF